MRRLPGPGSGGLTSRAWVSADYLDLYLVHWPVPGKHVLAYQELQSLQAQGKIKSIGVSNYVVEDLQEVCVSLSLFV
jgi:diketogulonate reductase-like aldo/keto reductase